MSALSGLCWRAGRPPGSYSCRTQVTPCTEPQQAVRVCVCVQKKLKLTRKRTYENGLFRLPPTL
eukprot:672842-Amphidinium_carterae.2